MALAGRYQPELPFARLAAHRHLLELGASELALDTSGDGWHSSRGGLRAERRRDRALTARTEGWAVACIWPRWPLVGEPTTRSNCFIQWRGPPRRRISAHRVRTGPGARRHGVPDAERRSWSGFRRHSAEALTGLADSADGCARLAERRPARPRVAGRRAHLSLSQPAARVPGAGPGAARARRDTRDATGVLPRGTMPLAIRTWPSSMLSPPMTSTAQPATDHVGGLCHPSARPNGDP